MRPRKRKTNLLHLAQGLPRRTFTLTPGVEPGPALQSKGRTNVGTPAQPKGARSYLNADRHNTLLTGRIGSIFFKPNNVIFHYPDDRKTCGNIGENTLQKELEAQHSYLPVQPLRNHLPLLLFHLKAPEASNSVLQGTKEEGRESKGGSSKQSSLQPVRTTGVLSPGSSTNIRPWSSVAPRKVQEAQTP